MIHRAAFFLAILLAFPVAARAGDPATVVRATDLREAPFSDAALRAVLRAETRLEVLQRQGGWYEVALEDGTRGWVRMSSLRLASTTDGTQRQGGVLAFLRSGRSAVTGATATTGVRGLSEEELANAVPDPQAVQTLEAFAVPAEEAREFARDAALEASQVEPLPEKPARRR
ncbi:MAG TPA: SH3 domain-containing protein [Gammaproteobacteria bacterium]|nr:SH3 domain-containing protein [Gammaproteobacteria bacterium]